MIRTILVSQRKISLNHFSLLELFSRFFLWTVSTCTLKHDWNTPLDVVKMCFPVRWQEIKIGFMKILNYGARIYLCVTCALNFDFFSLKFNTLFLSNTFSIFSKHSYTTSNSYFTVRNSKRTSTIILCLLQDIRHTYRNIFITILTNDISSILKDFEILDNREIGWWTYLGHWLRSITTCVVSFWVPSLRWIKVTDFCLLI